ncbi:hypothetical protein [Falsiroseomonas sp. HW251]|uniref:hypothetical protein n=1 Tax=Falsiroseomonas sp. HW251 TaxID=3390998 RepID=UPI003D32307A
MLPNATFMEAVQKAGRIDIVVRTMEDERRDAGIGQAMQGDPMAFGLHADLSGIWVALAYEVVRVLRQRKLMPPSQSARALMDALEAVRVPLMKHEIQREKGLKAPLSMARVGLGGDATSDVYTYDPKDDQRAHIMPSGVTPRGSLSWLTLDHRSGNQQWMERRYLSDLMLSVSWRSPADV